MWNPKAWKCSKRSYNLELNVGFAELKPIAFSNQRLIRVFSVKPTKRLIGYLAIKPKYEVWILGVTDRNSRGKWQLNYKHQPRWLQQYVSHQKLQPRAPILNLPAANLWTQPSNLGSVSSKQANLAAIWEVANGLLHTLKYDREEASTEDQYRCKLDADDAKHIAKYWTLQLAEFYE